MPSDSNQRSSISAALFVKRSSRSRRASMSSLRRPAPSLSAESASRRPPPTFGGVRSTHVPQHVGDALDGPPVLRQPLGIAFREPRDFALRGRLAAAHLQIRGLGQREEIGQRALHDAQPVLRQAQVADDLWIQQADRIGRHRIAEAGMELLGDGGPADYGPALQHEDFQARLCQVTGAGEAVVAGADDDRVVGGGRHGQDRTVTAQLSCTFLTEPQRA